MSYNYIWRVYNIKTSTTTSYTWKSIPTSSIIYYSNNAVPKNWYNDYKPIYLYDDGTYSYTYYSGGGAVSSEDYGWRAGGNRDSSRKVIWELSLHDYRSCWLDDNGMTLDDLISVNYSSTESRGKFVQEVSSTYRYAYPDNNKQYGYWYVYKDSVFVDDPPSTPSSITLPTEMRSGSAYTVSWSSSTDPQGTTVTYYVEMSINGGSYAAVANGTSVLSLSDTALSSWNTLTYRVRAYSNGLYSSYKTSSTITIKHAPEIYVNINGVYKQCDGVYVNIGGVWKEAIGIYTNIDGVWKES